MAALHSFFPPPPCRPALSPLLPFQPLFRSHPVPSTLHSLIYSWPPCTQSPLPPPATQHSLTHPHSNPAPIPTPSLPPWTHSYIHGHLALNHPSPPATQHSLTHPHSNPAPIPTPSLPPCTHSYIHGHLSLNHTSPSPSPHPALTHPHSTPAPSLQHINTHIHIPTHIHSNIQTYYIS